MKIENVLARKGMKVITIHPEQLLIDTVGTLAQHNIGALVVVDASGSPVGIISERDIMRELAGHRDLRHQRVSQVMTKDLVTGSPQDDLKSVLRLMTQRHFRHLPIVERGRLTGIVSLADVVIAQLDEYEGEIVTLEQEKMLSAEEASL